MKNKKKEQTDFIIGLQKEVQDLQNEIGNINSVNKKRAVIRNIKIFGKKIAKVMPFVLVLVGTTMATSALIGKPFIQEDIKVKAYVQEVYDNHQNYDEIRQYTEFSSSNNKLEVFSKWEEQDGYYVRTKTTYIIDEKMVSKCLEFIASNDYDGLKILFSNPFDISHEKTTRKIDESENKEDIVVTLHSRDGEDVTVRARTIDERMTCGLVWALALVFLELITYAAADTNSYKLSREIERIREQYKPIDVESLQKQLIIKLDNYNRLVGNTNAR